MFFVGSVPVSVPGTDKIKVKEVKSRMGNFCIVDVRGTRLITPCDNRVKILQSLCEKDMTAEDLARDIGASYSTVMDHMDLLEKVGLVEVYLKKGGEECGRRRICFRLLNHEVSEE